MTSLRASLTLLLALTLSLATSAAAQPLSGPEFIPLATPCRALDTRVTGTPLQANVPRTIQIGGVTTGGDRLWRPHHGGRRRAQFHDHPAARGWAHGSLAERSPCPRRRR